MQAEAEQKQQMSMNTTQHIHTSGVDGKLKDKMTELEHFLLLKHNMIIYVE